MRLLELDLSHTSILELGTGTGLVSLTAALSGAKHIVATDYNPFSLALLERAKSLQLRPIPEGVLTTQIFDAKDLSIPLPPADLVLIADMLYDPKLAVAVAERVCEAVKRGSRVIVGESPGRPGNPFFRKRCAELLGREVVFLLVPGETVTGHRNALISTSNTATPITVNTSILEL
jgi:predicted nicotinamide N-methyase